MSRVHRARWTWGMGLALMLVAGAVGGRLALSGSRPQPDGLQAFTPLAYAVSDLHVDAARHIIVASYGNDLPHTNRVVVIDARSGRILRSTDVGASRAQWLAVDFGTQRALAFSGFSPAQARLIDLRTGRIKRVIGLPLAPMAVAVDAATGDAVVSGSLPRGGAPAVALMEIASGHVVRVVKLQGRAGSGAGPIAFDDTTHRILVSSSGGLNLLDARTGTPLAYTPLTSGDADRIAVDRQTHRAFVALLNSPAPGSGCARGCTQTVGAFAVVDDRTGRLLRPRVIVPGTTNVGAFGVAARTHWLFVTDYGPLTSPLDAVYVVDTQSGKLVRRVHVRRGPIAVAVDERRNRVIVGGRQGVDVLDAQSGATLRSIGLPVDAIYIDESTGDFIAGNDFYVNGTPVQGNGIMQQILRAIQTSDLNPGAASHHMNGGVSVVNLRSIQH